jgi:NAD(P)-dependent dehydrogenase (short-subunit alcohol dehydrogenase family)
MPATPNPRKRSPAQSRPKTGGLHTTADIASMVAFLVGPDGGWINGQVLRANGGMV